MLGAYAWIASDPFSALALSIGAAILGFALSIGLVTATKRKAGLLLLPLALLPLTLWLYEQQSNHSLFRSQMATVGRPGSLVIYALQRSGSVHNHQRVSEALALIKGDQDTTIAKLHFLWAPSVFCADRPAHALGPDQVYRVLYDPAAPERFCVAEAESAGANTAACPAILNQIREKAAARRLVSGASELDNDLNNELTRLNAERLENRCP